MLSARPVFDSDGVRVADVAWTLAYWAAPGQEQRMDHPHVGGDDCTCLTLSPEVVASVWGGEPTVPAGALAVSPRLGRIARAPGPRLRHRRPPGRLRPHRDLLQRRRRARGPRGLAIPDGDGARFVWTTDLLPDAAAPRTAEMKERGLAVIGETLTRGHP